MCDRRDFPAISILMAALYKPQNIVADYSMNEKTGNPALKRAAALLDIRGRGMV